MTAENRQIRVVFLQDADNSMEDMLMENNDT